MKIHRMLTVTVAAAIAALAFVSPTALARPKDGVPVVEILQRCTPATAEDLQKMLFSAQGLGAGGFGPGNIAYQIHNPFRNRVIEGFVMHVTYVDPATKKDVALDVFVSDYCEPLQSSGGTTIYYWPGDNSGAVATYTLKEVYFTPEKKE